MCGQCHRVASGKAGPQSGLSLGRWSTLHPLGGDISLSWPFSHMPEARPFSGPVDLRRGHFQPGIGFACTCVLAPALKEMEPTSHCGFLCTAPGLMLHHLLSRSLLNTLHLPPFTSNSHSKPWLSLLFILWKRLDNSQWKTLGSLDVTPLPYLLFSEKECLTGVKHRMRSWAARIDLLENLDFSSLHWFQLQVKNSDLLPLGSPKDAFHRCLKRFPKAQEVQCWAGGVPAILWKVTSSYPGPSHSPQEQGPSLDPWIPGEGPRNWAEIPGLLQC